MQQLFKHTVLAVPLFFLTLPMMAQRTVVTATLRDSLSHETEPFATVRVFRQGNTAKPVAMAVADADGNISQKTEDLVGPYELHDFFLYNYLRFGYRPSKLFVMAKAAFNGHEPSVSSYDDDTIKHWLRVFFRRFFAQQFKRSCLPDGPKVGSVSLSPRGDWRMPSDASSQLWLEEIEGL